MLPENKNSNDSNQSTQTFMPIILSKTSSVTTISTQISLDSKRRPSHNISLNKPKKSCKTEIKINTPKEKKENPTKNYEIHLNTTNKDSESNNGKFQSGKWTEEEHEKFIEGILIYGNEWKKVQEIIKTRSSAQARSHAQKFFLKIKKSIENRTENLNLKINEMHQKIDDIITEIIPKKYAKNLNKSQKDKLLSAISCNIKCEDNFSFCPDLGLDLEEFEKLSNKCFSNDNNITNKNNIISLDLSLINEQDELCKPKNIYISKKRNPSKILENKDKMINNKKIESHRPSIDFTFNKIEKDNEDFVFENVYNQENKENIFKNSSISSSTNEASSNIKEEKGKNQYIINNVINVTNNYINQKVVYNIFNKEIFNNNIFSQDCFFNDKDDINNNEKNQIFFKNYQSQDNYINENQFNTIFNDFTKNNCKDNDFNLYENKIENENDNINNNSDPFQLNFSSFSNDNSLNHDIDSICHLNDFVKLADNI